MEGTRSGRSRSGGAASLDDHDRRFACTFPGCEKRFTRTEHLQRHALNHRGGDHACPRCSAAFKRPDLLDRHMNRHRQKDLEAGGEGCGVLDTRKRAWKAPDGAVVPRRPNPIQRTRQEKEANQQQAPANQQHAQAQAQEQAQAQAQQNGQALFQGQTTQTPTQAAQAAQAAAAAQGFQLPTSPVSERESLHDADHASARLTSIGSAGSVSAASVAAEPRLESLLDPFLPTYAEDPWQLWNEQPFQADTASSFNMPYTTALDYNWLFNMAQQPTHPADQAAALCSAPPPPHPQQQPMPPIHQVMTPQSSTTVASSQAFSASSLASGSYDGPRSSTLYGNDHGGFDNLNFNSPPSGMRVATTPAQAQETAMMTTTTTFTMTPDTRAPLEAERPLSMLDSTTRLPSLDHATHDRLLAIIATAKPCLPDSSTNGGVPVASSSLHDSSPLSCTSMQLYLDLFFTRFNATYPIIHLASFRPSTVEPLLLLAIILLGATYSTKEAHQVAVCIHDVIRPIVFAHDGFSARPALWTLQTILLVECFGKSRAGQKQHDMSHLFHGLLINLIRRSDCQSVRPQGPPLTWRGRLDEIQNEDLEKAWIRWAEAEQKKRLALYCFMWDTQHAVLFCQSLCMSAFELRLHFPCSQTVWEAPDARQWAALWWNELPPALSSAPNAPPSPQPFYLPTLRAYLTPGGPASPAGLNAHARVLVLHGLMSIFWDMQRRDQTTLGTVAGSVQGASHWRAIISKAYSHWKADFDNYCASAVRQWQNQNRYHQNHHQQLDGARQPDFPAEMATFVASTNAVYHAAQCLLRMEFLDIQIYAGARHILGRPVQQRDYLRSAQVVKAWASSGTAAPREENNSTPMSSSSSTDVQQTTVDHAAKNTDATTAAYHAARMLREVLPEADSDAMASLFHVPWCLYLAALTCWAFYHASPSRTATETIDGPSPEQIMIAADHHHDFDADEMVWDSRAEMDVLINNMTVAADAPLRLRLRHHYPQSRRRINGLVWVIADTLTKVRWGIVHAGVMVLRGLVPSRLINQYEMEA